MIRFASIVLPATVMLITSCASGRSTSVGEACDGATREVLAAALRYALEVESEDSSGGAPGVNSPRIPDYGLLLQEESIYVLNYVDHPGCVADNAITPSSTEIRAVLVSDADLLKVAKREKRRVRYVHLSRVTIEEERASVLMSVALRLPPDAQGWPLCCCGGEMVLQRESAAWDFHGWGSIWCR